MQDIVSRLKSVDTDELARIADDAEAVLANLVEKASAVGRVSFDELLPHAEDIEQYCSEYGLNNTQKVCLHSKLDEVARDMLWRLELRRWSIMGDAIDEVLRRADML